MSAFKASSITQSMSNLTGRGRNDGKYFQTTRRGEIHELKEELNSANKEKKKEAVKKVIAAMTVGKDVSGLFPDVVNCMQTSNMELKKLVYLYVINYAKAQPDLALLAVNTFRKDSLDSNPLIRALAVRTMGCIRLNKITEYLVEPLRKACRDSDPYVRKTAAICVAKLYDTSPEAVEEQGFIEMLQDMLSDSNPMVVANSVAALVEISESSSKTHLKLTESTVNKLLSALNECTEWGQVFILDAIAAYKPSGSREAELILERVTARLSHANAAVVMSAIKVVMRQLEHINSADLVRSTQRKICPPLVTLLSAEPEIQYVALRNILLIVQKRPSILATEVKMFFCKYNDPAYVKMEKLEVMVQLANEKNIDLVLNELKEYATEVDVAFVRLAVRGIGRCAVKIERTAERCINVLLELIATKVNYVVQEVIVAMKDVFRRYPNRYESVISSLCENLEVLDEPQPKAVMIWIIGEYAEKVANADELLEAFLENVRDEPPEVQLQLLTATVKLFLKRPSAAQDLVTRVLKICTEETDNPDLRDRGYIYWRLLSSNPEATKQVVLAERPAISDDSYLLDISVLDRLIENLSMLASVYHKVPEAFVTRLRTAPRTPIAASDSSEEEDEKTQSARIREEMRTKTYSSSGSSAEEEDGEDASSSEESATGGQDLLDMGGGATAAADYLPPVMPVHPPDKPGRAGQLGLAVAASVGRRTGGPQLSLSLINRAPGPMGTWALQIQANSFGLAPLQSDLTSIPTLTPGQAFETAVPLAAGKNNSPTPPALPLTLQVALRNSTDVFVFPVVFDFSVVLTDRPPLSSEAFKEHWQRMGESKQHHVVVTAPQPLNASGVGRALNSRNIRVVGQRTQDTYEAIYLSGVTTNNALVLLEVAVQRPANVKTKISVRCDVGPLIPLVEDSVMGCLGLRAGGGGASLI